MFSLPEIKMTAVFGSIKIAVVKQNQPDIAF